MEAMEKKAGARIAAAARAALAAALALMVCIPAGAASAASSEANDTVINIRGYDIDGAYEEVNSGVGYVTDDGEISYCYDFEAHGPGRDGQDYSDVRDGTHATDYLFAKGYPNETAIAGKDWGKAKAQAITQLAVWIVSGTADGTSGSFARADSDVLAAARQFAKEAQAYQGGDLTIDGCSTICYVEGKRSVQAMVTGSLGGRVTVAKTSADASVTSGNREYSPTGAVYGVYAKDGKLAAKVTIGKDGTGTTDEKLKAGSYTVKEVSAPDGWTLSTKEHKVKVKRHDIAVEDAEAPVTVKVKMVKTDAETGEASPQGAGSLDGAVYRATYEMDGKKVSQEATVSGGEATFEGIPLGKISVTEVKAPTGYLPDTKTHEFAVTAADAGHEAAVFELVPKTGEFSEQPVRGDLELVKVADGTQQRLAGVPFKVTSKTTGESHVIVTDANGYASTAASWNKHTADTNGGNEGSGIWFGASAPDDSKGALLYDTYEVEEQRSDANADRELIPAFDVTVYKDSTTVNLGTLTDDEGPKVVPPEPKIGTTATDADDGDHEAIADDSVTVNDEVSYTGLTPGQEYTLTGTLMDKETGKPVKSGGKDVTSTVAFTPEKADGTQTVTFAFDGADLAGHETVAFESLQKDGKEVTVHADINDEGQTVKLVPPEEGQPPADSEEATAKSLPKTGDGTPLLAAALLAGAAACGAGAIALAKRRSHAKEEGADDAEGGEE